MSDAPASPRLLPAVVLGQSAARLRRLLQGGLDRGDVDGLLADLAEAFGLAGASIWQVDDDHLALVGAAGDDGDRMVTSLPIGDGPAGEALEEGAPVAAAAGDTRSGGASAAAPSLWIPMALPDRVWGLLLATGRPGEAIGDETAAALHTVADLLAVAQEVVELRDRARHDRAEVRRLRRTLDASTAIVSAGLEARDLPAVIDRMVREIREQLSWDAVAVLLLEEGGTLRVAAQYGFDPDVASTTYSVNRGIIGHVATTGRPYLAPDTRRDPYYEDVVASTRSELCAPLRQAGRVLGVVNVESRRPGAFTEEDLTAVARIADHMGLIMHNVELLSIEKDTVLRLHELDRLKSRLLTIASHELRTPLTVVLGFAEVLAEHASGLDPQRVQDYATAIVRHSASLSRLVDHMLLAARIEEGQLTVSVGPTDLAPIVDEAVEDHRDAIEVLDGVGVCRVLADPFRLRQVLEILFENAVKYAADAGRIQIDARQVETRVRVLLRDEGPGIPGYEHERVFQPFHQVGEHGVTGRRGVGLGLAVARDLVKLMGGELKLFSAKGYGATFTIDLPLG